MKPLLRSLPRLFGFFAGKYFQKVLLLASRISNDQTISFGTKCKKKLQCGPCQTTMLPRVLEFSAIKYDLSVDKPNEFYDLEVIL